MTDYNRIAILVEQDRTRAASMKIHSEEVFHMLNATWNDIETPARRVGWDIFQAMNDPTVRVAVCKLRAMLLKLLPAQVQEFSAAADVTILQRKNTDYGESWKRRGGVGAFMMLARKWDRIETLSGKDDIHLRQAMALNVGDIRDDMDDLRRYLLLVEEYCGFI